MEEFNSPIGFNLNSITCSIIDDNGFLWFGTDAGLTRYDGSNFKVFKHNPHQSPTICGTLITSLSLFGDYILIGFRGDGIDMFDKRNNLFHHYNSST